MHAEITFEKPLCDAGLQEMCNEVTLSCIELGTTLFKMGLDWIGLDWTAYLVREAFSQWLLH